MTYVTPARTSRHRTRTTVYRRRRHVLLGAVLVSLLACAAVARTGHQLNGSTNPLDPYNAGAQPRRHEDSNYLSPVNWPQQGQAALLVGNRRPAASPDQHPAPIASLAKVMTAYLVLAHHPLNGAQDGFTLTVSADEARAVAEDRADGQSVVAVAAGEQLTERQLLEALLIPSANNIARMLAVQLAGSEARFVAEMNAEARALGMDHTTYTDPSGLDPGTVSTAADQLRVFRQAMRFAAFRHIVSMAQVTLPVAGTVTNFNPLVADGYAGKTGSDSAAGGCLAFFTHVTVGTRRLTAVGVVMGQGHGGDTAAILAAAGHAAMQLVASTQSQSQEKHE